MLRSLLIPLPPHPLASSSQPICPQEKGYSGIELERVQDSWVRNVRVVNVDNGFLVSNANRVTLQVCRACSYQVLPHERP